jgi:antitoxin VapB
MDTAKLFKNGQSQAVRLPKAFRFEGDQVYLKRVGNGVLLLPFEDRWQLLWDSLDGFTDDFMLERNQPTEVDMRASFE